MKRQEKQITLRKSQMPRIILTPNYVSTGHWLARKELFSAKTLEKLETWKKEERNEYTGKDWETDKECNRVIEGNLRGDLQAYDSTGWAIILDNDDKVGIQFACPDRDEYIYLDKRFVDLFGISTIYSNGEFLTGVFFGVSVDNWMGMVMPLRAEPWAAKKGS
jgi:hypothetical protein